MLIAQTQLLVQLVSVIVIQEPVKIKGVLVSLASMKLVLQYVLTVPLNVKLVKRSLPNVQAVQQKINSNHKALPVSVNQDILK